MGEGEGGRWRVKGTCLLQGGVATSGGRERVPEVLETGEHELGGPGAEADFPRGPGVRGSVPGAGAVTRGRGVGAWFPAPLAS